MTRVDLVVPPDPTAPSKARELLARLLPDEVGSDQFALGELALSEIVSNAIRHGGNGVSAQIGDVIERDGDLVTVRVIQSGPTRDIPSIVEMPEPWSTHGYGLSIVDAVTDRWGVHLDPPSVWFQFRLDGRPDPPS